MHANFAKRISTLERPPVVKEKTDIDKKNIIWGFYACNLCDTQIPNPKSQGRGGGENPKNMGIGHFGRDQERWWGRGGQEEKDGSRREQISFRAQCGVAEGGWGAPPQGKNYWVHICLFPFWDILYVWSRFHLLFRIYLLFRTCENLRTDTSPQFTGGKKNIELTLILKSIYTECPPYSYNTLQTFLLRFQLFCVFVCFRFFRSCEDCFGYHVTDLQGGQKNKAMAIASLVKNFVWTRILQLSICPRKWIEYRGKPRNKKIRIFHLGKNTYFCSSYLHRKKHSCVVKKKNRFVVFPLLRKRKTNIFAAHKT